MRVAHQRLLRERSNEQFCFLPASASQKKTLVLDLDETLVHSSFKPLPNPDMVITLQIDSTRTYSVYVMKRPGVDMFLRRLSRFYELVIFTASLSKYANPLLDQIDPDRCISARLFREHCTCVRGSIYVKDLEHLGRDMRNTIIIDNSPVAYLYQEENAIPITTWYSLYVDS